MRVILCNPDKIFVISSDRGSPAPPIVFISHLLSQFNTHYSSQLHHQTCDSITSFHCEKTRNIAIAIPSAGLQALSPSPCEAYAQIDIWACQYSQPPTSSQLISATTSHLSASRIPSLLGIKFPDAERLLLQQ